MRKDWRARTSPRRLELYFPDCCQKMPHAEESLLFVQKQCYAFCAKISTTFSLAEKSVTVCFPADRSPQLFKLLERIAPLTEQILLFEDHVVLYVKYFAEPSVKERALRTLFAQDQSGVKRVPLGK